MMDDNTKKLKLIKEITTKNSIETEKQKSSIIKDELIKTLDYGIACHFVDRIEKRFDTKVKLTEIKDERKQTISS